MNKVITIDGFATAINEVFEELKKKREKAEYTPGPTTPSDRIVRIRKNFPHKKETPETEKKSSTTKKIELRSTFKK